MRPEAVASPSYVLFSRVFRAPRCANAASGNPPRLLLPAEKHIDQGQVFAAPMPGPIAADNLAGLHSIGGQRQSRPLTIFRLRANRTSRLRELRETSHGQVLPRFSIFR